MIIDYPNQLDPGVLPLGLEKLYLGKYNHPLSNPTNILPSTITKLILPNYNQPISPGQMPSSLVFLEMREFNKPLVEGALPFGTLEKLSLPIYNHPFPSTACQSDQITLNHIKVFKLDQTITNVISSRITNLQLEFAQKQYPVKLPNSITNLKLEAFGDKAFTGTIKDLLPMHVKFITLTQLTLSPNLIPISCHTLVTDQLDFNRGDIPSNIQYLKIQNFAYRFKEFIEKYSKPDSFDIIPIKNVSLRSELTTLSIKKQ
ncbi:hypothetical protein CYY_005229 [Polysphondylium violaceum]|uniref:FNIP repeat-containing protein n=1 Tax=Polysphondylium violaceum TaxID=133409 RepID=A0A8J4PVD6_9MYCE|nr:hypothetical protein CYY_005229 [Polysphondylium violaceum]